MRVKPSWYDGFMEAESLMYENQWNSDKLREYILVEGGLIDCDPFWSEWCEGFTDYVDNLKFREGCVKV